MNVRDFCDAHSDYLKMFCAEIESGVYVPVHLTPLAELTKHEWAIIFHNWLTDQDSYVSGHTTEVGLIEDPYPTYWSAEHRKNIEELCAMLSVFPDFKKDHVMDFLKNNRAMNTGIKPMLEFARSSGITPEVLQGLLKAKPLLKMFGLDKMFKSLGAGK